MEEWACSASPALLNSDMRSVVYAMACFACIPMRPATVADCVKPERPSPTRGRIGWDGGSTRGKGEGPGSPAPGWAARVPREKMAPSPTPEPPRGRSFTRPLSPLRPSTTSEGVWWDGGRSPGTGAGPDVTPFNTFNTQKSRNVYVFLCIMYMVFFKKSAYGKIRMP